MHLSERNLLLDPTTSKYSNNKLSVVFAIICIVDVFGVFPVIALPKAVIDCGVYGIFVVALVCSIQIYTAVLLGKCWVIAEKIDLSVQDRNRYPYAALAEITFGKVFSNFVSLLVNITIFCGGIPNLIVASQNLQLLGLRLSYNTFDISFCYWIIILGMILCPVLWLGSPKDMKLLCTISVIIVVLVFLLVTGCSFFASTSNFESNDSFEPENSLWEMLFVSYGIISFQYDIHPSILTIQMDMLEKSKLNLAVVGAFTIVAIVAAVKFGSSAQPSLLETLPTTVPLHFAAFFVALQLCLSLSVSNSALFQQMEDCMNIPRDFNHRRCVLRTTLTLLAILIAESVPRFDLVMSLIGGTLTGPLVFILPPLFYIKMLSMEKMFLQVTTAIYSSEEDSNTSFNIDQIRKEKTRFPVEKFEMLCCTAIIIFSLCCTVVATYVNTKNAIFFTNFAQPCIFNVSTLLIDL